MRRHRLRATVLLVSAGLLIAVGAYVWRTLSTPWALDPPLPRVDAEAPDSIAPSPPSIIDAPVTYEIQAGVDSLEAAVPLVYGDLEARLPVFNHPRMSFSYRLQRLPFEVQVSGQTVSISTVVEYSGRVWYKPVIGPELSGSCGLGNAIRPRVRATLVTTGRLTPRWELRTQTRLVKLEPYSSESSDHCRLTILRIDVTDRVIEATRTWLEGQLVNFDAAVSRWPVRSRFERLWAKLERPIWLADSVYLLIDPSAAQLGDVQSIDQTVVAQLRLTASPRIVTGPRPVPHDSTLAIPELTTGAGAGNGAHIGIDATITYPVATALLRRSLVGRSVKQAGRRIEIRDVHLYGLGAGRMAMAITVSGAARGLLYFVGTPAFDAENHQIWVPDLDYDVGTANLLVRGFAWLQGVDILDFLRASARIPESAAMDQLATLAQRGINRTLTPGVELNGSILAAQGVSASATKMAIHLRASADAQIELAIRKSPRIPRPPGERGAGMRPAPPRTHSGRRASASPPPPHRIAAIPLEAGSPESLGCRLEEWRVHGHHGYGAPVDSP